ncbi:c-type cytochrome [sulfur-oxidizing endosymbiont of Gigantopelta aegis]|uniref:c-type cytochrome n=1 Tax=sulfur-oxidizing endosymbiont of Gigantopelta aegis TaxID=2794934 RepID=UPI001FED0694|nr:cytochrome c [sulfur-oxidizing endosymbiont of Gigantopelta aegis]
MKREPILKKYTLISLLIFLSGCTDKNQIVDDRWYTYAQIDKGADIFKNNCASCHGDNAQGTTPDNPAPALNGTAHAWHHPLKMLRQSVRNGSIPLGGTMPPFKDKLNADEIDASIAFFQSQWKDEIYEAWIKRGALK